LIPKPVTIAPVRGFSFEILSFYVPGKPVPQGAMTHSKNGTLFWSNSSELKPWRRLIGETVSRLRPDDWEGKIFHGIGLTCVFAFDRPKSHTNKKGDVLKKETDLMNGEPDMDKLLRAVYDAVCPDPKKYKTPSPEIGSNDKVICFGSQAKVYSDLGETKAGAYILIRPVAHTLEIRELVYESAVFIGDIVEELQVYQLPTPSLS
jgi:hypothetical protein